MALIQKNHMDPLIKPVDDNNSNVDNSTPGTQDTSGEVFPKWAYGVIAAGSAVVAGASVVTYHVVSKKKRQADAMAHCREIAQIDDKLTPRNSDSPRDPVAVSKWAQRPGEKIV